MVTTHDFYANYGKANNEMQVPSKIPLVMDHMACQAMEDIILPAQQYSLIFMNNQAELYWQQQMVYQYQIHGLQQLTQSTRFDNQSQFSVLIM
ncbi:hypothetical protein SS50377_21412 [Spironucleus salmonicida]|uniref:Uncharacterized protein n=1 Tax=Spironucleus salmonicida TaxID=348837 RepID=A0A9P8LWV4_9EUKA|nr:hypothetical protein SS50377_21412 [Spironucleus salmonicida]